MTDRLTTPVGVQGTLTAGAEIERVGIPIRVNLFKFVFLYAAITAGWLEVTSPSHTWLNWYLSIAWSLYLPVAGMGFCRIFVKEFMGVEVLARSDYKGFVSKKIVIVIPTVCRYDTIPALRRVINSVVEYAPRNLTVWRADVIVDEGSEALVQLQTFVAEFEHVRIIVVPREFTTPRGTHAKARANQYALEIRRVEGDNNGQTYVYHLDDDTHIETDTASSIAEFVQLHHGTYYLAQGILTFPHELSPSFLCRLADSIRPADDITRCGLFTGDLHTPLEGLHGEHMLVRADIEERVGWDFGDALVEDAYFALRFSEMYPGKSTALRSFTYGASPRNLWDFIKQRRRWAAGLLRLVCTQNEFSATTKLPLAYAVFCWMAGPFQFVLVVLLLAWLTATGNTSPVEQWIIFAWTFNLAFSLWQYMEGLKINMLVSKQKSSIFWLSLAMIPLIYLFTIFEGFAALCGLVKFMRGNLAFEVIRKEV